MGEAHARARALRAPDQGAALWFDALFEVRIGNSRHVAELCDQLRAPVDEAAMPQARAAHRWFRGWAEARFEEPRAGYRFIREGYEQAARPGMR